VTSPPQQLVIGVGAQKAGTTSLFAWLGSLAEVSTARTGKEIDYFSRYYDRGHAWYLANFEPSRPLWLDISPNYALVRDLFERMETLPVPYRCVIVVRDPVERAFSQHRHELVHRPNTTPRSFAEAEASNPTYVDGGLYGRVLTGLRPLVEQDRLDVVWFDDLVAEPAAALDALCLRLGIAERPRAGLLETPAQVSGFSRVRWLHAARRSVGRTVRRIGGEQAVSRFRENGLVRRALDANVVSVEPLDRGDPAVREAVLSMQARFRSDLAVAEELTGLPFAARLTGSWDG
jgi:hypothetical protein